MLGSVFAYESSMAPREGPTVSLKQGTIRGVLENSYCDGTNYCAFRGIPYAKPPIGELRFKDPLPPKGWTGIRDASKFGNVCAQRDLFSREIIGSDDCLYLNIYATSLNPPMKRPVMVWIHGGGFYHGSGNDDMYGPDYFVRKDVVLVTINYRLGVLGFLNLEDEVAPGNQGLKDQVMALRWVRDNIAMFGGDPKNVTIFGESAGGASVHYLTMSPLADGLFHKAISQSGVAINPWASVLDEPRRHAYQLSANLGFKSFDPKAVVDFLRTVDVKELVQFQGRLTTPLEEMRIFAAFCPGVDYKSDNPFLTQPPAIAMQHATKVPFLLGHNTMEGSFFTSPVTGFKLTKEEEKYEKLNTDFESTIPLSILKELREKDIAVKDFKRLYFGDDKCTKENSEEKYARLLGDMSFIHGIYDVVQTLTIKSKCPTYLYRFSYDDPMHVYKAFFDIKIPGTTHAEDLIYLYYGRFQKSLDVEPFKPGAPQYKIMEYFIQLWTDFARTGNPTPVKTELIPVLWEPLERNSDKYNYMVIDENLRMESLQKGEQQFEWNLNKKNKL